VDADNDFGLFDARGEFVTCWGAYEFETDEEFLAVAPRYEFVDHVPEELQETLRKVAAWVQSVSAPGSRPPAIGRYNRPVDVTS
jgi:hypothetical protein